MANRMVIPRGEGWGEDEWDDKGAAQGRALGDGTVLYLGCRGSYSNLHVIK